MKRKSSPTKQPRKSPGLLTCLDSLDAHHTSLETLAGLVAMLEESGSMAVDTRLVGNAGSLMLRELEQARTWRQRLEKEIVR